ncbi:MAG: hypothetical protein M3Y41_09090, partial [Pseudomonadota bacterium]|nr:hypothetical protein [Pseudomonadota bacterium]
FMAVFKAALAAGAVWLVWWRSGYPVTLRLAMSYITACFLMAAGPGLVWSMAHVALGAVLVHAGLALLLAACWFDRGSTQDLVAALGERHARRRRETPPISAA